MIPHSKFAELRLSQFVDPRGISPLTDWEFLDRLWVGEAIGFSEWLCPQESPDSLGSLALDLEDLPQEVVADVLSRIGLPLHRGMTLAEIKPVLGNPARSDSFVPDRISYNFTLAGPDPYDVFCTVLSDGGLIYLVVTVPEDGA